MALDGAMLCLIKNELNSSAIGCRIEKITMPYKDQIILFLNKSGFKKALLISANPGSPRIHFTTEKFENPAVPPMLCMLLRKKIAGGKLREVKQFGIDRVLVLDFDCKNELGDDVIISVIVEIMGRLSNVIFVENGKIIDCIRRFDPEEGKRFMLPGAVYEFPEMRDRLNLFETQTAGVVEKFKSLPDVNVVKAMSAVIDGLSPIIYREICFLSFGDLDKTVAEVNSYQFSKLSDVLDNLKSTFSSGGKPCIIKDEHGFPKDFTFIPITQYGESYETESFQSIDDLLQSFFSKKDNAERMKQISHTISKTVTNLIERTNRKIAARQKELKSTENKEYLREYGELIKANLNSIKSGDTFAECVNYYDPECKTVRIPLDNSLSPFKNAQKYFKDYRKQSTAAGMLKELIEKAENDLVYFESVFDELKRAKTPSEVEAVKEELLEQGIIKSSSKKKQRNNNKPTPERYVSSDGFEILVGKNNHQNDYLTTKHASKTDIWFHTKNIPGSHVIVVTNGEAVPDSTLTQAAVLAATNSKAAASRQVPVDYTYVKNVKKPVGSAPGMVIYKTNKTAYVDPDESLCESLKEK